MVFLLSCVSAANNSFSYNFQVGSILFMHLDGKGDNESEKESIIVRDTEIRSAGESYIPIVKIASANSNFAGYIKVNQDEDDNLSTNNSELDNLLVDYNTISPVLVQTNSFIAPSVYYDDSLENFKYGITKYKVEPGDSPGSIAASFGISTYTLLWANNLKVGDIIKPEQELEVLPISGVKHIVKKSDTIESIAVKYKADQDEITMYNKLPALEDEALVEGKVLIVPNGEKAAPVKPKPQIRSAGSKVISSSKYAYNTSGNTSASKSRRFPYGYCTYYVASRTYVPWNGHAKSWLTNSRAYGFRTGSVPVAGSIVVTTENRWYGHVAFVEAVHSNTITVSEMNYVGWGRKSVRTIPINSYKIKGYVYAK
ncbi:MAG: LysM peptidoglycan-binding domain-containing protein [Patescibacteria group bacterium]|nr:LysM peptidoglycan-binding domain-containing protein [Patescibacteria group bacterium]